MAVDATKVRVAISGALSRGLLAATAPTGTASSISPAFTDLGGITEDGVSLTLPDAGDRTQLKIWQDGQTVRTLRSTSDDLPQITVALVETKLAVIEAYFGVTVTQSVSEGTFDYKVQARAASSYVLDVIDGAELMRLYAPRAVVASVQEIKFAGTQQIGYGITLDVEYDTAKGYNLRSWMTALKS
ncbi:MAG: hypothetical protein F2667_04400 [Actinobacteria bacterium]|nr:hypothetical protein [Actinomycetota bacterium]